MTRHATVPGRRGRVTKKKAVFLPARFRPADEDRAQRMLNKGLRVPLDSVPCSRLSRRLSRLDRGHYCTSHIHRARRLRWSCWPYPQAECPPFLRSIEASGARVCGAAAGRAEPTGLESGARPAPLPGAHTDGPRVPPGPSRRRRSRPGTPRLVGRASAVRPARRSLTWRAARAQTRPSAPRAERASARSRLRPISVAGPGALLERPRSPRRQGRGRRQGRMGPDAPHPPRAPPWPQAPPHAFIPRPQPFRLFLDLLQTPTIAPCLRAVHHQSPPPGGRCCRRTLSPAAIFGCPACPRGLHRPAAAVAGGHFPALAGANFGAGAGIPHPLVPSAFASQPQPHPLVPGPLPGWPSPAEGPALPLTALPCRGSALGGPSPVGRRASSAAHRPCARPAAT